MTGLTAPTKGTAPVTSVTAPTNTTAAVKWYVGTTEFTGSTFAANTAYTAKVTLTPNTGYKFASGATYTIDGTTVTAADGTGDAKILTKTFPATESRTITALTITKQPTTLTYSHGDTLNTAGMVVKATYDDGSEDAAFTGYTVSYSAGGSYLNKGETSVNIAAGSQTATVTGLNVGAKTLTITGITATNRKYESGNTTVTLSGGTLVGVVVGETVGFDLNATSATIASADVGTGKDVTAHIVLTGANKDNYTLTQPTGIKVNINPADNTVSAFTCANVEFGTAPSPSGATATNGVAAYTYSATQTGTYGAWDAANGVGTYYVKAAVAASGNYAAGEKIQSFQVTAKSLAAATFGTVSSQPYTGSAITPEPTVTLDSQLTKGSDFDYTYSNNTYVGTATVNVAGKNNYTGAATTGAAFTITAVTDPAVITGTASVTKGGKTVDLSANVTGAKGTVSYLLTSGSGSVDSTAGVYTSPAASGSATVQVTIADKDMGGSAAVEYTGKTANITITINDKATQSTLICVPNKTTVEYGKTLTLGSTGGSGSGTVTYSVVNVTGEATISGSTLTATKAGTVTIKATKAGDGTYNEAVSAPVTITINKATLTGNPTFTSISTTGKKLSDVTLTKPATWPDGSFTWELPTTTEVTANTAYKWLFTPTDTANYNSLTGSITPYVVAPAGGGAAASCTLTFNTNGGSAVAAVSKTSGSTVDLTSYKPTRDGYTFAGWFSDTALTKTVASVKLTADTTVYAKWTKNGEGNPFTDVPDGAYYHDAVLWALSKNVTSGTSPNTFGPSMDCTRAQVVTFLWRAMGSPEPTGKTNPFTDVSPDAYYYKAVLWAVEKGITKGASDTTFAPDDTVTRAQFVTFLWRAANAPAASGTNPFTDVTDTGAYYYNAVLWAVGQGITAGTSATTFGPDDVCNRGQVVTFLCRYMTK